MSIPMSLLPPDIVSYHLLNWKKKAESSPFLHSCLAGARDSGDAVQGVRKSISLSRGDHWSSGDKDAKHLLVDGMQSGTSLSLLRDWREITVDMGWLSEFQLCSMFSTICRDKSVASFGDETQWLRLVRVKALEMYTATSLRCICF